MRPPIPCYHPITRDEHGVKSLLDSADCDFPQPAGRGVTGRRGRLVLRQGLTDRWYLGVTWAKRSRYAIPETVQAKRRNFSSPNLQRLTCQPVLQLVSPRGDPWLPTVMDVCVNCSVLRCTFPPYVLTSLTQGFILQPLPARQQLRHSCCCLHIEEFGCYFLWRAWKTTAIRASVSKQVRTT